MIQSTTVCGWSIYLAIHKRAMLYNACVTKLLKASDWEAFIARHPNAHLLQTPAWGQLKASFGWTFSLIKHEDSGALVLFRRVFPGFKLAYVPMGPVGELSAALLSDIAEVCRSKQAFMVKFEPDHTWDSTMIEQLARIGLTQSPQTIQPVRTIRIDLQGDEEDILMRMKSKTRYNIRLAARKGVDVRSWSDVQSFSEMMDETADRAEFGAHSRSYYRKAYELFNPNGECELLVAEFEALPVAAIMVFKRGSRAWYFYGASRSLHRDKMPTYALQWEAMRWARARGCTSYDLWGVPDHPEVELEAHFTERSHGLWGVYRFKRGFGGEVTRTIGAWDHILDPLRYRIYHLAFRLSGGR